MAFEMTQPKILFIVFLWLISVSLVAQLPYAEILNESEEICESGNIALTIKFYGEASFGIRYKIGGTTYTIDGVGTNIINIDKLSADNVWTSTETIPMDIPEGEASHSVSVEILRVWDSSVDRPWTTDNGTEISNQKIEYTGYKMPVPNAGFDMVDCGLSTQLDATPDPISTTFYWQDPAPAILSANDDAQALLTGPGEGTYLLTLVQDNGACQAQDQVEVILRGSPTGTISTTSEVCGDTPQNATLEFQFTGNGPWNYAFSNGTDTFSDLSSNATASELLSVTGETTFSLNGLTDINGCSASPEQMQGSATVIDLKPSPNAGDDLAICGQAISLGAIASQHTGAWSGPMGLTFDEPGNVNTTVTASGYGDYTLTWTEMNGTCSASDEVNVRFDQLPVPVNAGGDISLYYQYETLLDPSQPIAGEGSWSILSGPGELSSDPFPNTKISGMEMGATTLLWSVTNGVCPTLTDTLVISIEGLTYHTGFSPNGDGYNDTFNILGASHIDNNELMIFNQYGKIVYRKKNVTEEGWDGNSLSGSCLDDGIYYFVFTGDHMKPVKDYIILKKTQ